MQTSRVSSSSNLTFNNYLQFGNYTRIGNTVYLPFAYSGSCESEVDEYNRCMGSRPRTQDIDPFRTLCRGQDQLAVPVAAQKLEV